MAISVYNWLKDSGSTSTSFNTWVTDQGGIPRSLSIGADVTITGNLTIPSTIDIVTITNNAKFTGTGKTLTINRMTATPRHQIFDTGLHVLFASGATTYILPEWFGSGNGNVCFGSGINTPKTKVYVEGGVAIGTNLNAGSGNLYVAGSGTFAGVVHGVTPVGNTDLTTKLYVDTASGALDTRISATGLYAANVSGQLNTYITNTSGILKNEIDNKVPYSGASGDVNLGEYKLSVSNIQFDLTPSGIADAEGLLRWNSTDGTLDLGMTGGNVVLQIGQEMFIKARNTSGSTISNGTPVYASGRTGNRPNIWPAQSNSESTAHIIGITTEDIDSPADGYVTTMGYVRGIKTNYTGAGNWGTTWVTGDRLYVSKTVSGVLTNIEPAAPHHSDIIGTVEVVHSNLGSILVNIQKHTTLEELTDVDGVALTTSGQIPVWNQASGYFDFNENISNYTKNTSSGILIGRTTTSGTTLVSTEGILRCSGSFTVTLYQSTGSQRVHNIKNIGSGLITVSGFSTQTIDGSRTIEIYPGSIGAYPNMVIYDGISGNWDIL